MPEDVSVIGIDDHEMAEFFDLTTVAQPVREQGRLAAQLLLDALAAPRRPADPADDHRADPAGGPAYDRAAPRLPAETLGSRALDEPGVGPRR